jgi:hypothetical protein
MILSGMAAVLIALLAGFLWGASGKSTIERALERAELRNELNAARSAALAARVDIYNTNFGDASGHLEDARASVTGAMQRLESLDRDAELQQLQAALGPLEEAQRLAGKLDLGANARAGEAVQTLQSVLASLERP